MTADARLLQHGKSDGSEWGDIFARAALTAGKSLEFMAGRTLDVRAGKAVSMPLGEVPALAGSPEDPLTVVFIAVENGGAGQALLCLGPEDAERLAALLLGRPPAGGGQVRDFLGLSALAEAGNVALSAFLNVISDRTGRPLRPSVPVVVTDMAGAILASALVSGGSVEEEAIVVEAGFGSAAEGIEGFILYLPGPPPTAQLEGAGEAEPAGPLPRT